MHFPPGYLTCSYSQARNLDGGAQCRSTGVSRLFMTYGYQEARRDLFESSLSVRCTKRWLG